LLHLVLVQAVLPWTALTEHKLGRLRRHDVLVALDDGVFEEMLRTAGPTEADRAWCAALRERSASAPARAPCRVPLSRR